MKKYLSLLLAVVMLVSVLAGCGGKTTTPDPTKAPRWREPMPFSVS